LSFDPQMIESERGVVASERRTAVEDDNFGILDEQFWATAYTAHPYQWPIVGWMTDIQNWAMDDLQHHFRTGYSPSNATLVAVGAVRAEEILRLAEKHLAPIPAHAPPPKVTTREPEQLGERRLVVRKFGQLPILMVGYHIPESAHADYYALRVLQTILFSGQSSRLYQRLVDKDQIALFINGGFEFALDPTLFLINSQPKAGVEPAALEKAIYEELDKVKADAVKDEELEKAKNILLAGFYRQMKTISGKANTLGSYEVFFGDYRKLFAAAGEYAKVTKEDVRRVAQRYFGETNRTVGTLVPEAEPPAPEKP
jgi:zinc protease